MGLDNGCAIVRVMNKGIMKQEAVLCTTIDRDLSERLRKHARRERVSIGEVIQQALAFYFGPLDDKCVEPQYFEEALEGRARRRRQGHGEERQLTTTKRTVRGKVPLRMM